VDCLANVVNDAVGTNLDPNFFQQLGREPLRLGRQFTLGAGFPAADDELPAFFYTEPLAPPNRTARLHGAEVHDIYARMDKVGTEGVPDK
jgi:aldehyde:ferredoxin oxidoreductase